MHPSTRRAIETLERLADDEAEQRNAFAPRPVSVDDRWQPPPMEYAASTTPPPKPPRRKSHKLPERTHDDQRTRAYIERRLEQFAQMIGTECGAADRKLREEIGQLRAEVEVLKALLAADKAELRSARDSFIIDLPALPKRSPAGGH